MSVAIPQQPGLGGIVAPARVSPPSLAGALANAGEHRFSVSVVVPTCRHPAMLERCLRALLLQDFDADDYEIIVVDRQPGGAARDVVARLVSEWSPAALLHYLPMPQARGAAAARNLGWKAANGRVVAFTHDHAIPSRRWLREGLNAFGSGIAAVSGRSIVPLPARPSEQERVMADAVENGEFISANCFVLRSVLAAVEGFDERFEASARDDADLYFTLLEHGGRVLRAQDAVVLQPARPASWGASLAQQRALADDALLQRKHPPIRRERAGAMPRWDCLLITTLLLLTPLALLAGKPQLAALTFAAWALFTLALARRRLRGVSHSLPHVAEIVATSAVIPPLALYWRLVGAARYRVAF